jgi:CTP synthase
VPLEAVISAPDARSIYEVPLILDEQGLTDYIMKHLKLGDKGADLTEWKTFLSRVVNPTRSVKIACVGKYTHLADSYISHLEAFHHVGAELETKVEMCFVDSEVVQEKGVVAELAHADGILIPGGFGSRGIEGKIMTARYARENKVPFLGVCLGFQMATIEVARHLLDMDGANTTEIDPETKFPVIDLLPEQREVKRKGASMRLGAQPVVVTEGSKAFELYGKNLVMERHRHRFEVNPKYIEEFERVGWHFSGKAPDGVKMEIGELCDHPYFLASQFHPEFKSRPGKPSPLHLGLVRAALQRKYQS